MQEHEPFNFAAATISYIELAQGARRNQLQNALAQGWSIAECQSVQRVAHHDQSSGNFKIVAGDDVFILKESRTPDVYKQELLNRTLLFCEQRGVLVPHPINTVAGTTTVLGNGKVYSLYTFLESEHFDGSRAELEETAYQLSRLHESLEDLPFREQLTAREGGLGSQGHNRDDLLQLTAEIKGRQAQSFFERIVAEAIDEICDYSRQVKSADLSGLPEQIIHRDVHGHNLLFHPQTKRLLAIIDFENITFSQRIRDVAFAMHWLARTYGGKTERGLDVGDDIRDRAELFLKSYEQAMPLTASEHEYLADIICDEMLIRIIRILKLHYLENNQTFDFDLAVLLQGLREAKFFANL